MGGILVGETATTFFTGASRGEVYNVLYNVNPGLVQTPSYTSPRAAGNKAVAVSPDKNAPQGHPLHQSTEPINIIDER
jgi:hypothetical protein